MSLRSSSFVEPLESRIAPATVLHPLPDLTVGVGQSEAVVDLSKLFDPGSTGEYANRTLITIRTNFDADPATPGIQGDITIELFDDLAPLTVQNFLRYALNKNENGDYQGTFFHRLAEGFVLQGGGFQLDGKDVEHIGTFPEVHNEFDASRSNLRGTVALAKTGVSPNTGTSEWFINLGDNSGNLDNQNGGFTVFGRVIDKPGVVDGMEVVDKIAALSTQTGIVGDFPTPVQPNYNPDPDNNSQTPAPMPKASELITISDILVEPSHGGNAENVTYEFVGAKAVVNGQVTETKSNILTASIKGTNLNLDFASGKAGVAEVHLKANGEDVKFLVNLQPNLIAHVQKDGFATALVPGDTAKVQLDITNTGGALAKGDVDVHFYFLKVAFDNNAGRYVAVSPEVKVDANTIAKAVSIGSGKAKTLTAKVEVPQELSSDSTAIYQLFVEVTPKTGFNGEELFTDDNVALDGGLHQIHNQFGTFTTAQAGGRQNTPLTYTEADGDIVTFSIKGAGNGKLIKGTDGVVDLELSGTDAHSILKASVVKSATGDGEIDLRNIVALNSLGVAQLGGVDVSGNIAFTGGIRSLKLGDITGPSTMSIGIIPGAEGAQTKLSFGRVHDLSLDSSMAIQSLTAIEWIDSTGAHDAIAARALRSLKITGDATNAIRGDFEANVDLTSEASVNTFRIAGMLQDSTVRIYGNVSTVSVGGISDSNFLVGANERPEALADFTGNRTLSSFKITGLSGEEHLLVNSTVAAARINDIVVRSVDGSGEAEFGIVAQAIKSYNRVGGEKLSNLRGDKDVPGDTDVFDTVSQYRVQIID